jgi:hypothetical protein
MYPTPSRRTAFWLVPLVLVVACGAPEQGEEAIGAEEESGDIASEPMEEMPIEAPDPATFTIELNEMNASGVTGTASAVHTDESVEVTVDVTGVAEGEELPSHIHQGTCETGGSVAAPLSNVAVSEGSGTGVTSLDVGQIPADQPLFVQVHGPDGQPVACADIPAPHDM